MKATFSLGRVSGIPIGLHWSVLVLGLFASYNLAVNFLPIASPGGTTAWYLFAAIIGVVGLGGSVLLHELGHALVAQRDGVSVRSINLWALGGAAHLGSQPPTPRSALRISAAGPAVSFALALATGIPALALGFLSSVQGAMALPVTLLGYLGLVNLGLTFFNLLPALPLDGGRILQALLWKRSDNRETATISAAGVGRFLGGALVAVGLLLMFTGNNGLFTVLIGFFIRAGAAAERRAARAVIRRREAEARARQMPRPGMPFNLADLLNVSLVNAGHANHPSTVRRPQTQVIDGSLVDD